MLNAGGVQIATKYHQCKVMIRLGLPCFNVFPRQKQRPPNGCGHCAIPNNGSRLIKHLLGASWNLWTTLFPKAVLSQDYIHNFCKCPLHVQLPVKRICPKLELHHSLNPSHFQPSCLHRLNQKHLCTGPEGSSWREIWKDHPKQQEFQASRIAWFVEEKFLWFLK